MATLISIVGPTGVGKSAVALAVAQALHCPIVSADSVQIYCGMDIGSGKVTAEEQARVQHHMLDIVDPDADFSAGEYERQCVALLAELFQQHTHVVMVGGTGFYFQAVWHGLDEMPEVDAEVRAQLNATFTAEGLAPLQAELAAVDPETWAVIDRQNPARIIRALEVYRTAGVPISAYRIQAPRLVRPWENRKFGVELPRELLYARIEARVDAMMAAGWLAETADLMARFGADCKGLGALGYRELMLHLRGELELGAAVDLIKRNTRRYAKRQFTWFRRYADVTWAEPQAAAELILSQIAR